MAALRKEKDAPSMKLFDDAREEEMLWEVRESGLGATANVPTLPLTWPGWEDAAVPPERVGDYLRDFRKLLDKYQYVASLYGHLGQGCVHCRIGFDLFTREGVKNYMKFADEASDLVVSYGGSFSAEHGDGQSKALFLPKMYGPELIRAFQEFKRVWDPGHLMNPGKVIDPYTAGRKSPAGTALPALGAPHVLPVPQGRGQLLPCHAAVRGRWQMPQDGEHLHVPQLLGDARGERHDARPGPCAV